MINFNEPFLKQQKNNVLTVFLGGIILSLLLALNISAQSKDSTINFALRFKNNLATLESVEELENLTGVSGKFHFSEAKDFKTEFEKNTLSIFKDVQNRAAEFYAFLDQLDLDEKKKLIRHFYQYKSGIEKELKNRGLPDDFKYLAPALSAMNSRAKTIKGRAGIWQLSHFQSVLNGGEISFLSDSRLNPYLANKIAAQVLKQNIIQFKTPDLTVLAFLSGNTKARNILAEHPEKKHDGLKFWPNETKEIIAAFQALSVFLNENTFVPDLISDGGPASFDTVWVNRQIHFQQIHQVLNINNEQLAFLNPQFRYQIIPGNKSRQKILLPKGSLDDFIVWQDSIAAVGDSSLFNVVAQKIEYPPAPTRQYVGEKVKDLEIEGKTKIKYRIKTGDVLGIIAEKYDVRVADLKYWNNIYNERKIQAGRFLDIFVDNENLDYYKSLETKEASVQNEKSVADKFVQNSGVQLFNPGPSAKKIEHVVKSGESPYIIAKQYKNVTPELILEWNHIDNPRKIQIGQKLIIYQ